MVNKKSSKMTIVILTVLVSLVAFSFMGLQAQEDEYEWVTRERIGNPDADTVLTMWQHKGFGMRSAGSEAIVERMSSWAKKHPNVKIEFENKMPWGQIHESMVKLFQAADRGNAPDISALDSFWVPRFIRGVPNALKPLDSYLTEKQKEDFYPAYREYVSGEDGNMRALFWNTDVRPLWYRKDLVDEPPKTWSELITKANKIMEENPEVNTGFLTTGGRYENTAFDLWGTYWAHGGKLVNEDGRPVFFEGENRQKMLDVLKLVEELVDSGVMPRRVSSLASGQDLDAAISSANPVFTLNGNWHYGSLRDLMGEEEFEKKWAVAKPPAFEGDTPVIGAGGWTYGVFAEDERKRRLAFSFIWHVYGNFEGMAKVNFGGKWLPTRESVTKDYAPFKEDPFMDQFTDQLKLSQLRPGFEIYPDISRAFQVAFGEIVSGTKSPEQALEDMKRSVMEVYKEE